MNTQMNRKYDIVINGRILYINNQSFQVIKSAIQKYARRGGLLEEGMATIYHTDFALHHLENNIIPKEWTINKGAEKTESITTFAKRYRTNLANRLFVIMSEDINIHDIPQLPIHGLQSLQKVGKIPQYIRIYNSLMQTKEGSRRK